ADSPEEKAGASALALGRCRVDDAGSGTDARGLPDWDVIGLIRNRHATGSLPGVRFVFCKSLNGQMMRPCPRRSHLARSSRRDPRRSVHPASLQAPPSPETAAGKSLDCFRYGSIVPNRVPGVAYIQWLCSFMAPGTNASLETEHGVPHRVSRSWPGGADDEGRYCR